MVAGPAPQTPFPTANERVQSNSAGHVVLKLKTSWRDTSNLVMSLLEFMQRRAALVKRSRMYPPRVASRLSILALGCPVWGAMQSSPSGKRLSDAPPKLTQRAPRRRSGWPASR